MRWNLEGTELVIQYDAGESSRIPAQTIWGRFSDNGSEELPGFDDLDISFSSKYCTPGLRLVESETGSFGRLVLVAITYLGKSAQLSDWHRSDHVVMNRIWHPLVPGSLEEINALVDEAGLEIGVDLTPQQYLACIRDWADNPWFIAECEFRANDWPQRQPNRSEIVPTSFTATLAPYQERGSSWLTMMRKSGVGVVLGDGMGLGKTVQLIKTICDLIEENPEARTLVICPSAIVENWAREIEKFTKGVEYMIHVGANRSRNYRSYTSSIVITTYDVARIDYAVLSLVEWDLVVLDEAQWIKNPDSQRTRAIKQISRKASIAATGTPFENHMTDIWSIFDFCMPGFLGSRGSFCSAYCDDDLSAKRLGQLISPVLLRRRLEDIPNELPPIVTIPMPIALTPDEAIEYERRKKSYMETAGAIGSIQKLTSDLAAPENADGFLSSLKYEYLRSVLDEVRSFGEKIIVFAERISTIEALRCRYERELPVLVLNGSTPVSERQHVVDSFSEVNGSAVLICNPVVGGAGLNITAANHVFHFSMQWNPAKIDQADARAHRRGQDKPVVVHYPFYASTVEEYMWDKVRLKRELSADVVVGNRADSDTDEVALALSLSPVANDAKRKAIVDE